jgi:pectinesterase
MMASVSLGTHFTGVEQADKSDIYNSDVLDSCTIQAASDAKLDLTGKIYLGRPWTQYARVVYKGCSLSNIINSAGKQQHNIPLFCGPAETHFMQDGNNGLPPHLIRKSNRSFQLFNSWLSLTISGNVLFAEYGNTGDGSKTSQRASFSTVLTSSSVAAYSISAILGSGYTSWVDSNYF